MRIKITPDTEGFLVIVNGTSTGATYKTYDGACKVASAISDEAVRGICVIDYTDCVLSFGYETLIREQRLHGRA